MFPTDFLSYLEETELRVLELRFGLNDNERHTHSDIGKKLNISKERVIKIEQIALKKINLKTNEKDKSLKRSISKETLNSLTETIKIYVTRNDYKKARYGLFVDSTLQSEEYKPTEDTDQLVLHIIKTANKFKNESDNIEDLLAEGVTALEKAVYFYNKITEEGVSDKEIITKLVLKEKKFITFARLIIEGHISNLKNAN